MKWVEAVPAMHKACGACGMCCKLFDIAWLEKPKPAGKWCHHCKPGIGCDIWQNLPAQCASYFCVWRLDPDLAEEWRPDRARFILTHAHQDAPLTVMVDPLQPGAHRREPYREQLAKTARGILEGRGSTIVVFVGERRFLLFPDREVPIPAGVLLSDIRIVRHDRGAPHEWSPIFPNH
jgi:hypothetical protein